MSTKRNFGAVAALGGLTAAVALLTGLPSVRADELTDLRANQELLQRRIDQLAQAAPGGTPAVNPPLVGPQPGAQQSPLGAMVVQPGTPAGAGSFPRSFLIPGTDTSIRVGGFAQVDFLYYFSGNQAAQGTASSGESQGTINNPGSTSNLVGIPLDQNGVKGAVTIGGAAPAANVQHSRSNGVYITARESRFNVETRTPTAWGEARTFIEIDFQQGNNQTGGPTSGNQVSSSYEPRLRYAYATLGGLMGGQANSNFEDSDSNPELLDFGGNTGYNGPSRHGQLRYTWPVPWGYGGAFSVALEMPATDAFTPFGYAETDTQYAGYTPCGGITGAGVGATGAFTGATATSVVCGPLVAANNPTYNKMPDYTFAYQLPQPWGHFNLHGLFRDLAINDGKFVNKEVLGYAGGFGGDVKPNFWGMFPKDDITFNFSAGVGAGFYIADTAAALATNYTFAPASAAQAASLIVKPSTSFGGHVGYQHWWTDTLRSTFDYSMVHTDISSILLASQRIPGVAFGSPGSIAGGSDNAANKELDLVHANLIWSPVAFVDMGVEYTFGHRQVVSNLKGDENAIQGTFRVRF